MRPFFVYMLRCGEGSIYVGQTDNLEARFAQHQMATFPGFTSERLPVELIFAQECATRIEALELERKLKGWSRGKKLALAHRDEARLRALSVRRTRIAGPSTPGSLALARARGERNG